MEEEKVLVLFGAGASYGAGPCRLGTSPPLGKDLFLELETKFQSWASLPSDVKEQFSKTFEPGFVYMRARRDLEPKIPRLLQDMALYFVSFQLAPGNLYATFAKNVAAQAAAKVVVATLNYDLLVEEAFEDAGLSVILGDVKFGHNPPIEVLKIHGSPTFLPDIDENFFKFSGPTSMTGFSQLLAAPCRPVSLDVAVRRITKARQNYNIMEVPAMALYEPKKAVLHCSDYVTAIQGSYSACASSADRIVVVGAALSADLHVWEPIKSSPAHVEIYDPSETNLALFKDWDRPTDLPPVKLIRGTMSDFVSEFLVP